MATPAGAARWHCTLQAPAQVAAGAPVLLTLQLRLQADRPWWLLRWGTPFDPIWATPWLQLQHEGRPLPFQGATVKRGDPQAADYLRIEPGQTLQAQVDLRRVYPLDAPGRYRVLPQLQLHDAWPADAGAPAHPAGAADQADAARSADAPQRGDSAGPPRPRAQHRPQPLDCKPLNFRVSP